VGASLPFSNYGSEQRGTACRKAGGFACSAAYKELEHLTLDKSAAWQNDRLALSYDRFFGAGTKVATMRDCVVAGRVEIAR
jgi:hypothetical protein